MACTTTNNAPLGLLHVYTGDGKGKTTAAVGLACRSLGVGHSVLFCQFLKNGSSGEINALRQLGATIITAASEKFSWEYTSQDFSAEQQRHQQIFTTITQTASKFDVLLLDEVIDCCHVGLLDWQQLEDFIRTKPAHCELVLTGRNPSEFIIEAADYHTHFQCKKHPYTQGISARRGIEY